MWLVLGLALLLMPPGTFSSVYLAQDVYFDRHDNQYWLKGAVTRDVRGRPVLNNDGGAVALKKILPTSSPIRICNELEILEYLRSVQQYSPTMCGQLTRSEVRNSSPR